MSLQDVMNAFDPVDRADVEWPSLEGVAWESLEYFAWKDSSGHRAYVCVALPERDVGLVFRLHGAGRRGGLCDLCLGVERDSGTMAALVDGWQRPRWSFGLHVCANFDCSRGVRGQKYIDRMGETIPTGQAAERLQGNLEKFVRRVTGLDGRS
jgi:hypothetical protein